MTMYSRLITAMLGWSALALLVGCDPPMKASPPPSGSLVAAPQPAVAAPPAQSEPVATQASAPAAQAPYTSPQFQANPNLLPVGEATSNAGAQGQTNKPSGGFATGPAPAPTAASSPAIHLSAGIAVPQSLPDGTVMGMSVDYAFRGSPSPSAKYVWVIESALGDSFAEVQLSSSGTLQAFFPDLKPEHRPFRARIDELKSESQRQKVSNTVPLQTNY